MSNTAIRFEHVSKLYELGLVGTGTLSHDLRRWWVTSVLKREDPYLKIGQTNDRTTKGDSPFVYALRDIDFEVRQGDVLGIIGKNGAGKSTLLKLLSRITYPTAGNIYTKGRIASLLEVGTGFHPELTGRENIYMNGSILGMRKAEIDRKLDEIVDFSGCERYLDTPAKRYSSGMVVRLGFAIAAHLEPEILVVDEVLAVGDAEFQKKAIGKMQDVSRDDGRTVLFVSHNMTSVRSLCKTGIVLDCGRIVHSGTADDCVAYYLQDAASQLTAECHCATAKRRWDYPQEVRIEHCRLLNDPERMATDEPLSIELELRNMRQAQKCSVEVMVNNQAGQRIGSYISPVMDIPPYGDLFRVRLSGLRLHLAKGLYSLSFNVGLKDLAVGKKDYDIVYDALTFRVDYIDQATHTPIALWEPHWGTQNWRDAQVDITPAKC